MAQSSIINYLPKKHKSVKVIGNDHLILEMFRNRDYELIDDHDGSKQPDLVCFTGGSDVNPGLYGQDNFACGSLDYKRDRREVAAYNAFIDTPKVGICRGGQLLNVLSGGRMWQHVNGHGGSHDATDLLIYQTQLEMTSTHHQMMIAGAKGEVIMVAHKAKEFISPLQSEEIPKFDTEVVYYEHTKSLCFQPHPEYVDRNHPCNVYFFELLNTLL